MDELIAKLRDFLSERSVSSGGWAPVGEKDMVNFREIVGMIVSLKYAKDPDGDLPVQVILVDRTKFEGVGAFPIRYSSRATTEEEMFDILRTLSLNASMAVARLEIHVKIMNFDRVSKRDATG